MTFKIPKKGEGEIKRDKFQPQKEQIFPMFTQKSANFENFSQKKCNFGKFSTLESEKFGEIFHNIFVGR